MIRSLMILGIILALSVPAAMGAGSVSTKSKLIIGGDHDCPPYEFLKNGEPTGFNIELMRAVADVMGFEAEFRLGPWPEVRQELEQGGIDALAGMYYSLDRNNLVDFSVPHTLVTSGLFVRKDSPIRSFADIQGKEIIVQEGDIIHDALRQSGMASRIVAVTETGQALKLLASGKHDCAIMASRLQGEHFVKSFALTNIKTFKTELPHFQYCFAVRKGDQELLYQLDEGLKILKVNGKYRDIYEKWFGVYERKDLWETVKFYVLSLSLVAALCVAFLIWSGMLKRRVEQRTEELRRSEEALRFTQYAIDRALDQAFWMTKGGHFFYVNDAACRALGYSREELLQLSIPDIDPIHPPEVFAEHWRNLQQHGSITMESFHRAKNGRVYPVEIRSNYVTFDGKEYNCAFATDISERKRMEEELRHARDELEKRVEERTAELARATEALRESEARLNLNMDLAKLVQWDYDIKIDMFTFDDRFYALYGTTAEREGGPQMSSSAYAAKFLPAEDSSLVAREIARAMASTDANFTNQVEHRILRADGEVRFIVVRCTAVRDQEGRIVRTLGANQDITERKRIEEALRASEREKSLILNITHAHVIYFDPDMNILWANLAAGDSVNMAPEELQKRHCWEVWHQRSEPCPDCPVLAARETGQPQEAEICTPDGRVWFIRAYPVRNDTGRLIGMVEFTQDFTERKQMEEALRQANLVVENSPVVLFRWKGKDEWPVELVSRNIIQFGYTPDEFLSGSITYASIILPDDLDRVTREVYNFCNEGADQLRLEYRIRTKGGEIRWVSEHTNVERNAAGDVKNFEGIVIDITERKLIEEQLKRQKQQLEELNHTLEHRVQEEVVKNREKDIMLIQQNRQAAMGDLLEHIAHQLKQPLTVASLLVQNLWDSHTCNELTAENIQETINKTTDLLEHMAQTIEVFRDFYRPDKEKTAFRISDSVDNALTFISPALKNQSIAVELDVDSGLLATGYPREYIQVLLNVLSNARDALKERKTEKPKIMIKGIAEGNRAVVTITDNAGGIPESIVSNIFDLYVTTKEASGGTGIGLHMSKNIIEKNMHGSLTAHNTDSGAQFRIAVNMPDRGAL